MCEKCKKCNQEVKNITSIFLILTERCSLACKYCFVKQNPKEMSLQVAKDAIKFIVESSNGSGCQPTVNFFGGEPMLKYDEIIKPLIKYSHDTYGKGFVKFSMTSNGVHFTRENLEWLKSNDVGILMSLDGCKESHDANRVFHNGNGSFDKINNIIDDYIDLFSPCILRCTLERNNCHLMMDNVKFAINKGFSNIFFVPNSFVSWDNGSMTELKRQVREFGNMFIDYIRDGKVIRLNPFDDKIRQIKMINDTLKTPHIINGMDKCGLGVNGLASVGTDGTLYGCQEMTSNSCNDNMFVIGDIYNGIDDNKRDNLFKSFNNKSVTSHDKCIDCKMRHICNGGCVANNYMQSGDMSKQADIMCFWEQILLDEAIRVTNILGKEESELFRDLYWR